MIDKNKPPDKLSDNSEPYKCLKIKLNTILYRDVNYDKLHQIIYRVNDYVILCYLFLKDYVLHLYKANKNIPDIDESFVAMAFKALSKSSSGPKPKGDNKIIYDELCEFYKTHFVKLINTNIKSIDNDEIESTKYDSTNLSYIFSSCATEICTSITNNIKFHYFDYVKRYVNDEFIGKLDIKYNGVKTVKYFEEKKELRSKLYKVKNDLINISKEYTSDEIFHKWITDNKSKILPLKVIHSYEHDIDINPFKYLKYMLFMTECLEKQGKKISQPFPIRTTITPKSININTNALVDIFVKSKKNEEFKNINNIKKEIWDKYFYIDLTKLKIDGYTFDYEIKTNGYEVSLRFISNNELIKKTEKGERFSAGRKETAKMKKEITNEEMAVYLLNKKNNTI
jgi:hypothetical protein